MVRPSSQASCWTVMTGQTAGLPPHRLSLLAPAQGWRGGHKWREEGTGSRRRISTVVPSACWVCQPGKASRTPCRCRPSTHQAWRWCTEHPDAGRSCLSTAGSSVTHTGQSRAWWARWGHPPGFPHGRLMHAQFFAQQYRGGSFQHGRRVIGGRSPGRLPLPL